MSKLIKPQNNFTTIPNYIINDKRLSFKAKGLFLYLISKPDGWAFSHNRIMLDNNDGERSVLSGLKELESFGLLSRSRVRVGGVYKGVNYVLSFDFSPNLQNVDLVSPNLQNVDLQNVDLQNVDLQNVDNNKDSLSKKEIVNEDERENNNVPQTLADYEIMIDDLNNLRPSESCFNPDFEIYLSYSLCSARNIRNPALFKASIIEAFNNPKHKNHSKTVFAYSEWVNMGYPQNNQVLPAGTNIFDLIGRD